MIEAGLQHGGADDVNAGGKGGVFGVHPLDSGCDFWQQVGLGDGSPVVMEHCHADIGGEVGKPPAGANKGVQARVGEVRIDWARVSAVTCEEEAVVLVEKTNPVWAVPRSMDDGEGSTPKLDALPVAKSFGRMARADRPA